MDFKAKRAFIIAPVLTVTMLLILFIKGDYAPFGNSSLATMDAQIQYLDFFSYLTDVFDGENSIAYTFSKTLGGNSIAVFSYYLSSPFNLLLLFFEKENIVIAFNIIVVLKLAMAAFTEAVFLYYRFEQQLKDRYIVLLALSYALMQYDIAQSSNIMWLDGVYMLPLMLLGVYCVVQKNKAFLLIISCCLSILFNWYTAGINCIFTIIYFVLELSLFNCHTQHRIMIYGKTIIRYGISMLLGLCMSLVLFLPTIISLSTGGRGSIDWSIFSNTFSGNVLNIVQNSIVGSLSSYGSVSLYCGSVVVLFCIDFFVSSKKTGRYKLKVGIALVFSILMIYWQPTNAVFSLFKSATSYWYRYSYVTIFFLIFVAALDACDIQNCGDFWINLPKIAIFYSLVLLTLEYLNPKWGLKHTYYTCFFLVVLSFLLAIQGRINKERNVKKYAAVISLISVSVIELTFNAKILMSMYHVGDAAAYKEYSTGQQEIISEIKNKDDASYRVSQTTTYNYLENNRTANYNEALAYNYWSISGYTSDPDDSQREFLDKLGYRINGENMCITNTSIIAADSLLGVKYVLSPYEINGLVLQNDIGTYNNKSVYLNPYSLPIAFTTTFSGTTSIAYSNNPFIYQNDVYSALIGENIDLYEPLQYESETISDGKITFTIKVPEGNYAIYGNIPWNSEMNAVVTINNEIKQDYSVWLSPSVFYIPSTENGVVTVSIECTKLDIADIQFYGLSLDSLEPAAQTLTERKADSIDIDNGNASFTVNAESDNEYLFVAIPYNDGWTVIVNGEAVEPATFENCLMLIPLNEGKNNIEMTYQVPGLKIGALISAVTFCGVIIYWVHTNKKQYKLSQGEEKKKK